MVLKLDDRVIEEKSRPIASQWPRRISLLWANSAGVPVKLVYWACRAAIFRVTFSPPPAIHSGRPPSYSGSGRTMAPSTW